MASRKLSPTQPKKRQLFKYSESALKQALEEIRDGKKNIREASRDFCVPRSTIQDRLHGRIAEKARKIGPDPILGIEGEKKLADWIVCIAKCGFPIKKQELFNTVEKVIKDYGGNTTFKQGRPGQKWYEAFLRRNPNISLREAEGINRARAIITEESIRLWFRQLENYLREVDALDILSDPERIFNGDESGFALCPKSGKVLGPKGWRNLYEVKKGKEKENLTVLIIISADGKVCPPTVVFPYVRPPKALIDSMPEDWTLGRSKSGWMTSEVFFDYICNDFNSWVVENQIKTPILLFVDGHKSHMSMGLSKVCDDYGIILYALPPNTTHILQPADVSVFKPLKAEWKKTVREFLLDPKNHNATVTKLNFCKLYETALKQTNMKNHIQKGFRKCGLYPFNADAVDYTKCVQNLRETLIQPPKDGDRITEEELLTTERVIKSIESALTSYGISVQVILNELNTLRNPNLQTMSQPWSLQNEVTATCSTEVDVELVGFEMDWTPELGSFVLMNDSSIIPQTPVNSETAARIMGTEAPEPQCPVQPGVIFPLESQLQRHCLDDVQNNVSAVVDKITSPAEFQLRPHCLNDDQCNASGVVDEITSPPEFQLQTHCLNDDQGNASGVVDEITSPPEFRLQTHCLNDDQGNASGVVDEITSPPEFQLQTHCLNDSQGNASGVVDEINSPPEFQLQTHCLNDDQGNASGVVDVITSTSEFQLQTHCLNDDQGNASGVVETITPPPKLLLETHCLDDVQDNVQCVDEQKKIAAVQKLNLTTNLMGKLRRSASPGPSLFSKHLTFPQPILKSSKVQQEKLPSAISSKAWRQYYEVKETTKLIKIEENNKKKQARLQAIDNKKTLAIKKTLKKRNTQKIMKNNENKKPISKKVEQCGTCLEDLISDVEDDEDKNIGCDLCPRWFHLKCSKLSGMAYHQVMSMDYKCDLCEV